MLADKNLFDFAVKMYTALIKAAGNGEGMDRRLLGLRFYLKEGEPVPELFGDPLYDRSGHWALITSAIFSDHFPLYGLGVVASDCFEVVYMTEYDGVRR